MFTFVLALFQASNAVAPSPTFPAPQQEVTTRKVCKTIEIPTSRLPKRVCETVVVKKKERAEPASAAPTPQLGE